MNLSLYHPEYGYYSQIPRRVGKSGDFFTSVSCGPVFGILLAEKIAHWWRSEKVRGPWRILEPGANNAALAIDILQHLRDYHPETYHELQYSLSIPYPFRVHTNRRRYRLSEITRIASTSRTP
jgi:SAM-dependent MidA family methyltransferase